MNTLFPTLKKINHNWSLFLDRDGVINVRLIDDYVKNRSEFVFLPNVQNALVAFNKIFEHIFVVTNQQGVGKGLMTMKQVDEVHEYMLSEITKTGGRIDRVYVAPYLASENNIMRKPAHGMALKAKKDFQKVRFQQSVMVGDSISDMQFGKRLKMMTVFISDDIKKCRENSSLIDFSFKSLWDFSQALMNASI